MNSSLRVNHSSVAVLQVGPAIRWQIKVNYSFVLGSLQVLAVAKLYDLSKIKALSAEGDAFCSVMLLVISPSK